MSACCKPFLLTAMLTGVFGYFGALHSSAQVNNTGNLYIASTANAYVNTSFINNATASYQNNGLLYVSGDFTNNQSGMVAGNGTTNCNGTLAQAINGTAVPSFNHFIISNSVGVVPAINVNIAGDWTNNGVFSNINNNTVVFNGTAAQQIGGSSATTFYNLTNSNVLNTVTMANSVTTANIASLPAFSVLAIGSNTLTLGGTVTGTGTMSGTTSSTLNMTGSGQVGTLYFAPGGQQLGTISINRTGIINNYAALLGTPLTVNAMTLTKGIIATGSNLLTWTKSGALLPAAQTAYAANSTGYKDSYICLCDGSGNALSFTAPFDVTDNIGFRIKNVGTSTWFPVGVDFNAPNRAWMDNTGTVDDMTILLTKGDIGATAKPVVERIWSMYEGTTGGTTANMKLYFTKQLPANYGISQDEVEAGFDYTDMHLVQKNYNDPNYIDVAQGGDIASGLGNTLGTEIYGQYMIGTSPDITLTADGINQFSRFTVMNITSFILPVTITNLRAWLQNNAVEVSWTSVNELNIDHYEVERSFNGISFSTIGATAALNNGSLKTDYLFPDLHPQTGKNYYRIKVIEKDGHINYTNVVLIETIGGKIQITIAPNPVINKKMIVSLANAPEGKYNLILYGSNGQKVWESSLLHAGGSSGYTINLPGSLTQGMYFFHVENTNIQAVNKLMVQ